MNKQRIYILIAAIIGIISTFLPWVTALGGNVTGSDGDGWISLVLFLVIIVLLFIGNKMVRFINWIKYTILGLGIITAAIGIFNVVHIEIIKKSATGLADLLASSVSLSDGLFVLIAAGIAVAVLSILKFKD